MNLLFKNGTGTKGITLVEVMMVVFILGILAAVMVPKFADQTRRSTEGQTKVSLTNLHSALLVYFADNIGVDASTLTVLVPDYIDAIPTAEIGHYHANDDTSYWGTSFTGVNTDAGGWFYVTPSGAVFVNCVHTDTRGTVISSW